MTLHHLREPQAYCGTCGTQLHTDDPEERCSDCETLRASEAVVDGQRFVTSDGGVTWQPA